MATTKSKPLNKEKDSRTYAERRREEKDLVLRDYLRTRKYLDAINRDLDREDITPEQLPIIKWKTETRLKLVNKELPDVSAVKVDQTVNANVTIDAAQIDARLKMLGIDIG